MRGGVPGRACATAVVALLLPAPAAEAAKPITGKLTALGYTVIALDSDGEAASMPTEPNGGFKLRPSANRVTLHLRAADGTYAGPVVIEKAGKKGNKAVLGVVAGAELGTVKVRSGYAKLKQQLGADQIDRRRKAKARRGVPIGAGNFGRVAAAATGTPGPGQDHDRDGIPTSLDIDDDGDLVLDDVDTSTAGAARAIQVQQQGEFNAFTGLFLGGTDPTAIVNANAPGLSDEQIQSGLRARVTLHITIPPFFASGELDCGALVYCSAGGTGRRVPPQAPGQLDANLEPFPACCDPDDDGLGSLDPPFDPGGGPGILLQPGAGADQVRGGDLLLALGTTGAGQQQELAVTLNTVFVTVPAIASYVDELGVTYAVSYPVAPGTVFPVVDGPDAGSDVSVSLTFWRPQRRPIPDELPPGAGSWVDIGRLPHFAGGGGPDCPESSYSAVEQELAPSPQGLPNSELDFFLLIDSVPDQAADPANTFSYTLNLSQCLAFHGVTFGAGETRLFHFEAALPPEPGQPTNSAASIYSFQRQP